MAIVSLLKKWHETRRFPIGPPGFFVKPEYANDVKEVVNLIHASLTNKLVGNGQTINVVQLIQSLPISDFSPLLLYVMDAFFDGWVDNETTDGAIA